MRIFSKGETDTKKTDNFPLLSRERHMNNMGKSIHCCRDVPQQIHTHRERRERQIEKERERRERKGEKERERKQRRE